MQPQSTQRMDLDARAHRAGGDVDRPGGLRCVIGRDRVPRFVHDALEHFVSGIPQQSILAPQIKQLGTFFGLLPPAQLRIDAQPLFHCGIDRPESRSCS